MNLGNTGREMVRGLLPSEFRVAGLDTLRDKGLLFVKRLADKGVPTNVNLFPGVPHRFRRFRGTLKEYVRCDKVQEGGIKWIQASRLQRVSLLSRINILWL
jgi:acetyl esterase/lipase